jgi:hypothetical protein
MLEQKKRQQVADIEEKACCLVGLVVFCHTQSRKNERKDWAAQTLYFCMFFIEINTMNIRRRI